MENSKARAYRDSSVQDIPTGEVTKIELNAESYDVNSEFDPTTNYRFTAKKAGYYMVRANITYSEVTADKYYRALIRKNGATVAGSYAHPSSTSYLSVSIDDIISLAVGDYIELFTAHNAGEARNVLNDATGTYLSIHKLS
jgi:hypothetical protein